MSVHYKFKAALDFSTVTFDGIHISVSELKKSIIDQKRLGKNADFDLQIINAQTKEVYGDENALIPKNTSVIVARVPITDKKKSGPPLAKENAPGRGMHHHKGGFHQQTGAEVAKGSDLSSMDLSEEEKIKAMMTQSTADYDPSHYVRIRGANQHGRVPDSYRCNKCNQGGHWITRCPNVPNMQSDVKKSTGIPRSFMVVVDSPDFPGALMTPEGRYAVPAVDHAAYLEKNKGQQAEQPAKPKIPDDLVCTLCNDLLTDALLVPCCANSYCDDCIRSYLLESDHECPGCHEKDISPTSLIPNRFLRGTVNAFKNETGYSKPEKVPERIQKPSPTAEPAKEEPRKLSLDELPDDLFPHSPKKIDSENEASGAVNDPDSTKDLYDFNDGSIPSPFASPKRSEHKADPVPTEQRAIQSLTRPFHGGSHPPHGGMMRGPPPAGQPPEQHHAPPPHHAARKPPPPSGGSGGSHEPPPPGFDVPPPGEDVSHRPSNGGHDNGPRDARGPSSGPPPQQPPMSMPPGGPPPSFNPLQPPPGYPSGPPPPHGPPGMPPGLPPPGFGHPHGAGPNMSSNNFNRLPMPMNRGPPPMHQGGPPPRYHMDQDEFGHRGRGRRPYPHEPLRDDENRPGVIDDPLKEFERLMREKDRRKKIAASGGPRKRSKSRSFSPSPRRTSPYPPKRSRSRSFSRSPSPKRKRPLPGPKRRRSYSRSPSRTPPPIRRLGKSRSRSPRNRSMTPTPPGKLRRSPRRAPPQYSPSPPPSRFNRKEKDEYFERGRDRDRYDDRSSSRFPNKSSYGSRDYDSKYDAPPPSKYDNTSPAKLDPHKYDSQRPPVRPYHGHMSHSGMTLEPPSSGYRDKTPLMEPNKRPYDYEPNIVPPGTEPLNPTVPSILDINVTQPHPNSSNVYAISTIGAGSTSAPGHHHHHHELHGRGNVSADIDKGRREARETEREQPHHHPSVASAPVAENKKSEDRDKDHQETEKEKRKKSPVGKKHKKEKKKHKKKSKEEKEKKGRKERKKSKDEKSGEGEKSSDDDQETEHVREKVQIGGSLVPVDPLAPITTEGVKHCALASGAQLAISGAGIAALPSMENLVADSSVVAAKQTAPCDSTVKSPDRVHELMLADPSIMLKDDHGGEKIATVETVKRRDSVASQSNGNEVPDNKKSLETQRSMAEEIRHHLPPSKWDEFEDYNSGGAEPLKVSAAGVGVPPIAPMELKREHAERTVTSEVIKRAELAIFDKPLLKADSFKPVSPSDYKETGMDASRKYDKDLPLQSIVVHQNVKPDLKTSSVVSAVSRKSAKDRLGSKLSEDEVVLNVSKTIESAVSIKSKVSAVRDSGSGDRRRRSRSRSPAYASGGRYNRSRSRSIDKHRNRSRHSSERQQKLTLGERDSSRRSPPRKSPPSSRSNQRDRDRRRSPSRERRRSPSRERRRSPSRERRRSGSREKRRSQSRERRSLSKGSRDRSRRRSPSRERKKSASRERERERRRSRSRDKERERKRSNSRTRRRSKSRERRRSRERERRRSNSRPRRSRSPEKRRSSSRDRSGRRRSTSREREQYRSRPRSPFKRPGESSRGKDDLRDRDEFFSGRGREPSEKIRLNLIEERKEPIPHSSRASDSAAAMNLDEPPSPEARVFQSGSSSRPGQVFSPTLKKQKGRINIKLSSISKTEQQQSGSSSSDEDHDQQDHPEGKAAESGDEKKRKKRRHSSTSTKSSSSSDTKRKKKKKEKKKKKKKKKSK